MAAQAYSGNNGQYKQDMSVLMLSSVRGLNLNQELIFAPYMYICTFTLISRPEDCILLDLESRGAIKMIMVALTAVHFLLFLALIIAVRWALRLMDLTSEQALIRRTDSLVST